MLRFLLHFMLRHERSIDRSIFALIPRNALLAMRFLQLRVPLLLSRSRNFAALHHITGIGKRRRAGPKEADEDTDMSDALPGGGTVRKLWIGEADAYRDHLLRLDRHSRHTRFSGTVSDEFIVRHAATAAGFGVVLHGFFVDGTLRGAAELRRTGSMLSDEAEAAFSIEQEWQSNGVGTVLLERTLLSARNRGIRHLRMDCLADNRRMQQLARKFEAGLTFDFGSVVGEVAPPRSTPLSLMREAMTDAHGVSAAIFEAQSRMLGTA
jgi:GNAT superfamily N-acetyltransferase